LKEKLRKERQKLKLTLDECDKFKWQSILQEHEKYVKEVNKKIDKFNLIVPILNKQMCHIQLKLISEKILEEKPESYYQETSEPTTDYNKNSDNNNFLSLISSILK
jgi:DnaJ homolog subfamily C member 28